MEDEKIKLSLGQTLKVIFLGICQIGTIKKAGWSGSLPLYAYACPTHGIVQSHPMGIGRKRVECPSCDNPKYVRPVGKKLGITVS